MHRLPVLSIAVLACAVMAGGCGSPRVRRDPGPAPLTERADRRPPLPSGWHRVVNPSAGFSLGLPPGWGARVSGGATIIRSNDRALAMSVSADRSETGRDLAPGVYLRRAARRLPGYEKLSIGRTTPVPGARYPTASVTATGSFRRTGVRQALVLIAVHRPRRVTYVLSLFRSAGVPAGRYSQIVYALLGSFSAQPPAI